MRIGKVYHNIELSDYVFEYKRFTFVFSSKFYFNKFQKELSNFININNNRLNNKYNVELEASEYLALSLYKSIEKRGFLVYYNSRRIEENTTFSISISALKYL